MQTTDDQRLLKEYFEHGSQEAFAQLVANHVDLVFSAALRQLHDRHLAEDATQTVFLTLARKAGTIRRDAVLASWLLTVTRFVALDLRRSEQRRLLHEQKAAAMIPKFTSPEEESESEQVSAVLDEAIATLGSKDRKVVVLRYFQGHGIDQIAAMTGTSAPAARQRLHRAIGRLKAFFVQKGIGTSMLAIEPILEKCAVQPAPPHLAAVISKLALSKSAAAASTTALTKGAIMAVAGTNTKLVIGTVAAIVLLAGSTATVVHVARSRKAASNIPIAASPANIPVQTWKERFNQVYALQPNQPIKFVPRPFIPERLNALPGRGDLTIAEFYWDGSAHYWSGQGGLMFGDLGTALSDCTRLKPWEIDESLPVRLSMPGDWVWRREASIQQVMHGLATIVSEKLGRTVRFEMRPVSREAIIARGTFQIVTLEGHPDDGVIDCFAAPTTAPAEQSRHGILRYLLDDMEYVTETPIFDETTGLQPSIKWRNFRITGSPDMLVSNVAKQTSLRFDRERRQINAWFMVDSNPSPATISSAAR